MSPREALARAFTRALGSIDLTALVRGALPAIPREARLIAIGKAAPAMALGALDACARALVIAPDGTPSHLDSSRAESLRAAHPVPDERSVLAAERALDFVRGSAFTVVLLSGGASSLVCAPHADFSLDAKRDVTRALLAEGASIAEINTVRRHLSRIKGGGLAAAASPGRVVARIVSDVLGDALHDIGSGPTVADPTTVDDARAILARLAPRFANAPLHETAKHVVADASIIASPSTLAAAVAAALAPRFRARLLPASSASVDALAEEYAELARTLRAGEALVRSAEPTLRVATHAGTGGRCAHLAARVALDLPRGVAFLAGASDGADGTSSAAGASVDASTFADRAAVLAALAAFDTAPLHARHGSAIALGPTGLNFTDVHVLARG
jgi:glycerate 2-kinase